MFARRCASTLVPLTVLALLRAAASSGGSDLDVDCGVRRAPTSSAETRRWRAVSTNWPRSHEYVKTVPRSVTAGGLRLADVSFERQLWTEAADRYSGFVKLHPTSPKVDYAAYRVALSHYRDIPGDWFLVPPSSEKDQTQVFAAWNAYTEFVRMYPDSQYIVDARKQQADVRDRLIRHEIYVANFYEKRNRWAAAVNRLATVVTKFPGPNDDAYLFRLYGLYSKLQDQPKARGALERIIKGSPGTPSAEKARQMLGS